MDERLRKLEQLAATGDAEAAELLKQWQEKLKIETPEDRQKRLDEARKRSILARVRRIIEAGLSRVAAKNLPDYVRWEIEAIEIYNGWAEGSGDSDVIVVAANWNNPRGLVDGVHQEIGDTIGRIRDRLEKIKGVDVNWSESIATCEDCAGAISTQPSHYGWTPPYAIIDDSISCRGCIQKSPNSYLESLEGNPNRALTPAMRINLTDHGYRLLTNTEFETGFHHGQNDSPANTAQRLRQLGLERFIFSITNTGQFDTQWVVYIAEDELYDLVQRASHEAEYNNMMHFLMDLNQEMQFGTQIEQAAIRIIQTFLQDASLSWPSSILDWMAEENEENLEDEEQNDEEENDEEESNDESNPGDDE